MKKNKTGKYFKYAIGEIVLVVVGILIALSINNWNEDRKLKSIEINVLKGIKQNILMDTIDLNHNLRRHKEMTQRDSFIISHLLDKKPLDSIVERKLIDLEDSNMLLMLHTSYFDEVKSKGLSMISNKILRDSIARLYEFKYEYLFLAENETKQYDYLTLYENLISDYIYLDSELKTFKIGEEHYQTILTDKFFIKKLFDARSKRYLLEYFYDITNKAAINVIEQIDIELDSR